MVFHPTNGPSLRGLEAGIDAVGTNRRFPLTLADWDVVSAVQVMRWIIVAGLFLRYAITLDEFTRLRNAAWLTLLIAFAIYSFSVGLHHFRTREQHPERGRVFGLQVTLDTAAFAGFYLLSGSPASDIFLFFFLPLLIAADRFKTKGLIAVFGSVCSCYIGTAVALSYQNSPFALEPPDMSLGMTVVRHILPRATFFFLLWFIALVRSTAFRHETEELRAVNDTAVRIIREEVLETRLSAIRDAARERLEASGCVVYLSCEGGKELQLVTITGLPTEHLRPGHRIAAGQGVPGVAFQAREPTIVNQYQQFPAKLPEGVEAIRSAMAVPLIVGDRCLGAIGVFDNTGHKQFDNRDLRTLGRFAQHAAVAVRNAQLMQEVTDQSRLLEARFAISEGRSGFLSVLSEMLLSRNDESGKVYDRVLAACQKIVPSAHSCIWLVNQSDASLVLRATRGLSANEFVPVISIASTITGDAVSLNRPTLHPDCSAEQFRHKFANPAKLDELGLHAMAIVPVRIEPGVEGPQYVMSFFFRQKEGLPGEEQLGTLHEYLSSIFNLARILIAQQVVSVFRQIDGLSLEPGRRYHELASYISQAVPSKAAFLFVWDPLRNALILRGVGPANVCSEQILAAIRDYDPLSGANAVYLSPKDEVCGHAVANGHIEVRTGLSDWLPFESSDGTDMLTSEFAVLTHARCACIVPVTDVDHRVKGVVICVDKYNPLDRQTPETFTFEDVSVLGVARQELLVRLERDEFTTYVSSVLSTGTHELGLPIRSIADYVDFCLKAQRPFRQTELEELKAQADLLLLILRGVSLSGQHYGLRKPVVRSLDLEHDVIRFAQAVIKPIARQKGVRFDSIAFYGDDVRDLHSDRVLLRQVLFNLLSNAVKYVGRRQDFKVIVNWRRAADVVFLTVDDYGMGIAEADRMRVFEYGFRATGARKADAHGIGVGLTVSKRVMQSLGGDLALVNLAQPTSFEVTIPLRSRVSGATK